MTHGFVGGRIPVSGGAGSHGRPSRLASRDPAVIRRGDGLLDEVAWPCFARFSSRPRRVEAAGFRPDARAAGPRMNVA